MVRAWRFAFAAACHAGSNPAQGRFSQKYHFSPLSTLAQCFDVCVLGQGTLLPNASLDSGGNEYLAICSMRQNGCMTACSPWS